jgi:iron complex outermembrane receptor protein
MQKNSAVIGILLLCFFSTKLKAQQEVELDPVTITSAINPITLSKTGRNILVISGERIKSLPVNSIDELLRYLPGIEVQARGPMGAQSDFVLRGGTFQQVLVILDGLRVNDPLTGHFNSYIPITPSEIDRIEILKGASSAIYGTEAVGGVIQIISKTFVKRESAINKRNIQGQVIGGPYGLFNVAAGGSYPNEKNALSAGVLSNNAAGQPQRGTNGSFHVNTFSASASHQFSQNVRLAFRSSLDHRRFAAQNFYTTFLSDTATETVQTFWNQLRLDYNKNKNNFSVQVGYKTAEDKYAFNSISTANVNRSKLFQALATNAYQLKANTILTGGAQVQNRIIKSNDRGDHSVLQSAVFLLLDQELAKGLHINPAARLDWNERSGFEWVPQINASYRIAFFQLRGSAGKTIREADFTERYNNYNKARVSSGSIGNPALIAERSISYEGGADLFLNNYFKFSATYFQRKQKDLIDYVPTPYSQIPRKENLVPTGNYAFAKNIARVTTKGFETDLQFS